jgi:dCMP deaminase
MAFIQIAEVISRRSTCFRRNVGAVITRNNRIISVGYNGSPAGQPHCTGAGCADPVKGCTKAIHSEINALDHVPKGHAHEAWRMYVTESPCPHCARAITDSPVRAVYFLHPYRLAAGRDMLMAAGIDLYRMTPAGHIIDCRTEELVDAD